MDFQDYHHLYNFLFNRSGFWLVRFGMYRNTIPDTVDCKYVLGAPGVCINGRCFSGFVLWITNSLNTYI